MLGALARLFGFARDNKSARPRVKPFDDPGGYAAHGDWPFVPSDLKVSVHHARKDAA